MVTIQKIRELGLQIGREFQPDKVLLFGSHARGDAGPDSDIDFFVIIPCRDKSVHKAVEIRLSLDHSIPIDVLVRTPEEVDKRLAMGDTFIQGILDQGIVLYERNRR
ncbi:MAG: nucleotidyltransferase domain-containing protein [bacterium]|nr:nucleotidyltransferase domain-containing protein [bacterium]